jgi:hypothetical protein
MSQGKYSPCMPNPNGRNFEFNCFGMTPQPWTPELRATGMEYDEQNMAGNYDSDGFDSYGYSAFNDDGTYAGSGAGIDRDNTTEMEYSQMSIEEYQSC